MARDLDVATRLRSDATLMAILTGKVWAASELGTEGITSPTFTPAAYQNGLLKPACVVKLGPEVDDPRLFDENEQVVGETVRVECWLYERITSTAIEAAKARLFALLQGHRLPDAYPALRVFTLATRPDPDMTGVMLGRVDYLVRSVHRAIPV